MKADIDSMGTKEILQDGMSGRATAEEWVRDLSPATGGPYGFKRMGGVQRRSIPSWFSEPGEEGETRKCGCNSSV